MKYYYKYWSTAANRGQAAPDVATFDSEIAPYNRYEALRGLKANLPSQTKKYTVLVHKVVEDDPTVVGAYAELIGRVVIYRGKISTLELPQE